MIIPRPLPRVIPRPAPAWVAAISGPSLDPDAADIVSRIQAADGQALVPDIVLAIDALVLGLKEDASPKTGVTQWQASESLTVPAVARTLAGAMVPWRGPAMTQFNFVTDDYNRVTGLKGDGSTKYINSNRNHNTDAQNNQHTYMRLTDLDTVDATTALFGAGATSSGTTQISVGDLSDGRYFARSQNGGSDNVSNIIGTGINGISRGSASMYRFRTGQTSANISTSSQTPFNGNMIYFGRNSATNVPGAFSNCRANVLSSGSDIDFAAMEARWDTFFAAVAAALA